MIRACYLIVLQLVRPLWWICERVWQQRSANDPQRVLLIAYNDLTARYLQPSAEILRRDGQVHICCTRPPFVDSRVPRPRILGRLRVKWVGFFHSLLIRWDLIVVADHFPAELYHPRIRKMFVTHGLFAGKRFDDSNYVYGRRAERNGTPAYYKMLASGPAELACAEQVNPSLRDRLALVGDCELDQLLAMQSRRADIRARLGYATSEKVILIASSWGPSSLVHTVGEQLFEQAIQTNKYRLIVSVHPNNLTRGSRRADVRRMLDRLTAAGIRVIAPDERWQPYLTAADAMITDYTSLGLYFAPLVRPLAMVPFDEDEFTAGSPLRQLAAIVPKIDLDTDLVENIDAALRDCSLTALQRFSKTLVRQPGTARSSLQSQLHEALDRNHVAPPFTNITPNAIQPLAAS